MWFTLLVTLFLVSSEPSLREYTGPEPPQPPKAIAEQPYALHLFAVSDDGSRVAVAQGSSTFLLDGKTLKVVKEVADFWGRCAFGGGRFYIAAKDGIHAYDVSGGQLWKLPQEFNYQEIYPSPNGTRIAIKRHKKDAMIVDATTGRVIGEVPVQGDFTFFDENHILYKEWEKWNVMTLDGTRGKLAFPIQQPLQWKPWPSKSGGVHWTLSRTGEIKFCQTPSDKGSSLPSLPGWISILGPTEKGFFFTPRDRDSYHIGFYDLSKDEVAHVGQLSDADNFIRVERSGASLYATSPAPGIERGVRLIRYATAELTSNTARLAGDPVFAKKGKLAQLGLQFYDFTKDAFRGKKPDDLVLSYSRTHALTDKHILERSTLKRRSRKVRDSGEEFSNWETWNIVDGGRFIYGLHRQPLEPSKVVLRKSTGGKACSFTGSGIVGVGPKGKSFSIEKKTGGTETLVARNSRGKELWRIDGEWIRPADVHPKGTFVSVERGLLNSKDGAWVKEWPMEQVLYPPRFNSAGTFAIVALKGDSGGCIWEFYDPKKRRVAFTARWPQPARPIDATKDASEVFLSWGTFGCVQLWRKNSSN